MGVAAARPHPKCGCAWLHLEPPPLIKIVRNHDWLTSSNIEISATRREDTPLLHIQLRPNLFKPCEKSDTFYLFQAYELDWRQLALLNDL